MSLEAVELWRPRRGRRNERWKAFACGAVAAVFAGAFLDAVLLRNPDVFLLGIAESLALVLAYRIQRQNPARWALWMTRTEG